MAPPRVASALRGAGGGTRGRVSPGRLELRGDRARPAGRKRDRPDGERVPAPRERDKRAAGSVQASELRLMIVTPPSRLSVAPWKKEVACRSGAAQAG